LVDKIFKSKKNKKNNIITNCNINFFEGFFKINKSEKKPIKKKSKEKKINL